MLILVPVIQLTWKVLDVQPLHVHADQATHMCDAQV
jgi:hypothetical protein